MSLFNFTTALVSIPILNCIVGNNRCGGNDRQRGFYAAEWNGPGEEMEFALSRDELIIEKQSLREVESKKKGEKQGKGRKNRRESTFHQCSQPPSPSLFGFGRDGLRLIVRLFRGVRTNYAREGEDRTDYRGLQSFARTSGTSRSRNHTPPNQSL